MSWDDSNYDKRVNRDNEDLDDIPFTGKKKPKKKTPFVLERMFDRSRRWYYRDWKVVKKYETLELAQAGLDRLLAGHKDGVVRKNKMQSVSKDIGTVIQSASVDVDGELYVAYRIIKKQ